MTNRQIAKNNSYNKLLVFFAKPANAAIWVAFLRLVTEIANFVSLKGALDLFIQQQGLNTKGVTTGKTADFNAMIDETVTMANKAYVWAVDNSNEDLTELFDVQHDTFEHIAEEVAYAKVQNIREAINTNIGSMASVNLLPADVTALDGFITAYNASKGTTGDAKSHKETGTKGVADQMHTIDASVNLIARLIISQYSSTNGGMVNDFKFDRHIDDLPTNHSGIHVHITDADTGNDLAGAKLSIIGTGKTTVADLHGIAEIIKVKPSEYNILVAIPGYIAKAKLIKIKSGQITALDMQLTAGTGGAVPTPPTPVTIEGNLGQNVATNINTDNLSQLLTMVLLAATGSIMRFYVSDTAGALYNPAQPFIDVLPGQSISKTITELQTLLGANSTNKYLNVQNMGLIIGHYSVTFS